MEGGIMIKKLFMILSSIIIIAIIFIIIINLYMYFSVKNQIVSESSTFDDVDCILVLGAGVRNGQPTPMLSDRLTESVFLYKVNASTKILMSGDHVSKNYDEVNAMKKFAISKGIPTSNIFMDHAGISTYDSLYRAKYIFKANKVIIVSQEYHLYRALYIANELGIEAVGVSATKRDYGGQIFRDIREVIARSKDFVKCLIKPKSKYLGEEIPVSGNGNITND
jgi:vancomycin permeability regulator SanA